MVGTTILDRYELKELIGSGGMGAVFSGVQVAVNRPVAVKLLPKLDPLTAARFHREAKTASRLSHPNTITVFDFGQTQEGFLFLVMEHLEGRTLGAVLKEMGAMPPRRAVHIANQVCRSLSEAHASGIVHRDIKPDNIFIIHRNDDPDYVKVLDFGIAKIMMGDDSDDDLTQQGRIVGTPRYMAPEQVLGLPIDHRADIYSLGCILYQMLTGSPPFDDTSTAMLMMKHAHELPAEFVYRITRPLAEAIPPGLEAIAMKALSKHPEERQQTIDMLRTELDLVMPSSGNSLSSPNLSQPIPRLSGSFPASQRVERQPRIGDPHAPLLKDPTNPSGSNPSLSHPALMPHGAQTPPRGSGAWPVTVNQPPAHASHPSPTPPRGSAPLWPGPQSVGAPPISGPPRHPRDGGDDQEDLEWPPKGQRVRMIALGALALVLILMLIAIAGVTGFIFARPEDNNSQAIQAAASPAPEDDVEDPAVNRQARITITSVPNGGTIYRDENPIGETPMVIDISSEEAEVRYTVKLDGHQAVTRLFTTANIPDGGDDWNIDFKPLSPVAENDPQVDPKKDDAPEDIAQEPKRDNRAAARRLPNNTNPREPRITEASDDNARKPLIPAEDADKSPPVADKSADPKASTDKRKPNITALDGGAKPRIEALDGGGKPKVQALDGDKPKVKPLE